MLLGFLPVVREACGHSEAYVEHYSWSPYNINCENEL